MTPVIKLATLNGSRVFIRVDRIESFLDLGDQIHIRMMSGVEHKVGWKVFEAVREDILKYMASLDTPFVA
jgi:hypothetical protein